MNNLFRHIFHKSLSRAKNQRDLNKLQDDVGGLIGTFRWDQIDNKSGLVIASSGGKNQVTNLSKSAVIRLISQGTSNFVGAIDPTDYRITKMRFGNAPYLDHNGTPDKTRAYLDYNEKVFRNNLTTYGGTPQRAGAGGNTGASLAGSPTGTIISQSGSDLTVNFLLSAFGGYTTVSNTTIEINLTGNSQFPGIIGYRPPSHESLSINVKDNVSAVVETQTFYNEYSRVATGNPSTRTDVVGGNPIIVSSKLVWNVIQSQWRLQITFDDKDAVGSRLTANITSFDVKFKIGAYNIANSIVPKSGANKGSGTESLRFVDLDYYSVSAANLTYSNAPLLYDVDDYAAAFSVTMNGTEGNGLGGDLYPVVYTEAFLFCESGDLFSILRFDGPDTYGAGGGTGFVKDSTNSLFLTWSVSAAL